MNMSEEDGTDILTDDHAVKRNKKLERTNTHHMEHNGTENAIEYNIEESLNSLINLGAVLDVQRQPPQITKNCVDALHEVDFAELPVAIGPKDTN